MDLKILDSWIREYLITKASVEEFSKFVSLSGPTVDRTNKVTTGGRSDYLYEIEVTTNRVDAMSVYGIAREAAAILPLYKIPAKLKPLPRYKKPLPRGGAKLKLINDPKLTKRLMGVVVDDIKNWKTPSWMAERLEAAGVRSKNAVVDITNYVMLEVGHPCHAFDYDKLPSATIRVRESKKGEKIVTFDGREHTLKGGDIVFDDGKGNIIDLPGISGTKNTVVNEGTKRVLFFFDTCEPKHIRKTSMELAIRTNAAVLNEKGVDPELADDALLRGLVLFENICKARVASPVYDVYPSKFRGKKVLVQKEFVDRVLGVEIAKDVFMKILNGLGFGVSFKAKGGIEIDVPSFRATDINIPEDIVEEIARMYGYHNLPSRIMEGGLPSVMPEERFEKERTIRKHLTRLGGLEVYTFSLVPFENIYDTALRLKNPLGADTEYLRDSLLRPLEGAACANLPLGEDFHIFEMGAVFLTKKGLPEEKMILGGIVTGEFSRGKGVVEKLFELLNVRAVTEASEYPEFKAGTGLKFKLGKEYLAKIGVLRESGLFYYEADVEAILKNMRDYPTYQPIPAFPPQIEDLTFVLPEKTRVGEIVSGIAGVEKVIKTKLSDIFENAYTFRVWYQDPKGTLKDQEVAEIRKKVIHEVSKLGGVYKD